MNNGNYSLNQGGKIFKGVESVIKITKYIHYQQIRIDLKCLKKRVIKKKVD